MTDAELEAEIRHILALAAEATPGPWACSDNVEQIFGVKHWDWWEIYAKTRTWIPVFPSGFWPACRPTGARKRKNWRPAQLTLLAKSTQTPANPVKMRVSSLASILPSYSGS